ncbi:ATP-binding cassette domain-containing protein [Flavobacterium sp. F-328]|uniref:ATP-binding cassette domain-containing protein n=1 Tax=Flavobacterium erciyesense TaxID=2825842 RepID=A0ABS5D323_9FLAO|nr:ABC transporter ATP-binding protein [Flavobacterium erciyesense]MBQ0908415.1 ATP-binding cassette domain-containing protein [Flavobacterium erciyesense]
MKDIILKAENISKQYRLGVVGTGSLMHDLNRWWHQIRGKEDPYLKIGETNDRSTKGESDYVWALQDINFEIGRGEVIGIIGKNGAGKSTLLKILSRVTAPTTGSIKFGGRVASLLEVGTGFNGEMTGRENIYLNGAILGMTKKEITSKLDEIIEFSGCQRYIDTPVKRYSSGMYVRLAFAVAAFLEPEILIIDEVLAVGDAEFQKKAIGKMQDISKTGGRTVLFVSHNMAAVKSLCTRGILLENGKVKYEGSIDHIIERYLEDEKTTAHRILSDEIIKNHNADFIKLIEVKVINTSNAISINHGIADDINIEFTYDILKENELFTHGFNLFNIENIHILSSHDKRSLTLSEALPIGRYKKSVIIPGNLLAEGSYTCSFAIMRYNPFFVEFHEMNIVGFNIIDEFGDKTVRGNYFGHFPGIIRPELTWKIKSNE